LTTPQTDGPFPAALLISGMGPNDRDYTTCGHKLFLVLADHLTRNGIAVLRVDKRGIGKSTGTFDTTLTSKDLSEDVLAGIEYLKQHKKINPRQIGLIGHSEGGMIAAMLAAQSKEIAFIVSMAGAMATDVDVLIEQTAQQLRADGAAEELIAQDRNLRKKIFTIVTQEKNTTVAETLLHKVFTTYWTELSDAQKKESAMLPFAFTQDNASIMISMFNSPWYRYFLARRPLEDLKQITIPVLAINGDRDWIVSTKMLPIIAKTLQDAGNNDCTTTVFPNLHHQFRTCKTGSLQEYSTGNETIAPEVLKLISEWVLNRTINK
jgi:pimeloyl-ACP methyl ester carboxylesterase